MNPVGVVPQFSPEQLLRMPDGDRYELVNGEPVEKNMGWFSAWVGTRLARLLGNHCEENGIGWVTAHESGYQGLPGAPNAVRKPDVSLVRLERMPIAEPPEGNARVWPDLAAEVVSPNDLYCEVEQKVEEYLAAGVRLVWVIDPSTRKVRVHRADRSVADVRGEGELSGEDVAPGFHCRVSDLFRPPTPRPSP